MTSNVTDELEEDLSDTTSSKIGPDETSSGGSNRRRSSYNREIIEVVKAAMDSQSTHLQKISSWQERKYEREAARQKLVVDQIEEMTQFDEGDKIQLLNVLLADMQKTEFFLALPMPLKKDIVWICLEETND